MAPRRQKTSVDKAAALDAALAFTTEPLCPSELALLTCGTAGIEWAVHNCTACNLYADCKQPVCGDGLGRAQQGCVFVIGEAPGAEEDEQDKPFVGPSGQLLRDLLNTAGILNQCYITNAVRCRPVGNRTPEPAEVEACSFWTRALLQVLKPSLVISCGAVPTQFFLGPAAKITKVCNKATKAPALGPDLPLFPLMHPAAALRSAEYKQLWQVGLVELIKHLRGYS